MLAHTYPHKPLRIIKVTMYAITRLTAHNVWGDVWSGDWQVKKNMAIHDTECPYWDQVPLNLSLLTLSLLTACTDQFFLILDYELCSVQSKMGASYLMMLLGNHIDMNHFLSSHVIFTKFVHQWNFYLTTSCQMSTNHGKLKQWDLHPHCNIATKRLKLQT